ncbi:hypothetical protein T265_06635 [Opisthorchis viverrini]|uniref:Uncharacterized protein n=1 Tax=Opisthorchis viverrini TaxID=6198 RepID=A0A074ZFK4_OPIVI|nr:hypothetical protein T265_06635 [Opisthorchis viverrini]KER26061.1 hypothetical protein T265_06635 [Opisthorchis viverrini]
MYLLLRVLQLVVLGYCLASQSPHAPVLSSGKVIGTVITACNNLTFHTPPGDPYPTRSGQHLWLHDSHTPCLSDSNEALEYCRKVYTAIYPELTVDHVVVDPFKIIPDFLPWFPSNASSSIRVYLCLGPVPQTTSDAHLTAKPTIGPTTETPSPAIHHRLPTLIDMHRVYFAEQFHHLWNVTHSNVSQIISDLVQRTKGLFKLYPSNPQLVQYTVSQMLKDAHERLQEIWAAEEREWSVLEQNQHEDLASQMGSDEWAGENMFAFALQESHPDGPPISSQLGRVQDALAVLLSKLADSVSEEVRHLKSVHSRQPWLLRLDSPTNWTDNVTLGVTNLEQIHQVLLKHVHVATLAINAFHSIMAQQAKGSPPSGFSYKPTLVASYDRLQTNLFEAQRLLNQAKSTLLGSLANRMNSILSHLNATLKQHPSVTNISLSEWVKSKHHAELAYIDLLVAQLLSPYVASVDLPVTEDQAKFIWQPVANPFEKRTTVDATDDTKWSRDHIFIVLTVAVCSASLLSTFLFCLIRLVRTASHSEAESRRRARLRSLVSRGGRKLRHLVDKSQQKWISGTSAVWKVGPRVVLVSTDQATNLHSPGEHVNVKLELTGSAYPMAVPGFEPRTCDMRGERVTTTPPTHVGCI